MMVIPKMAPNSILLCLALLMAPIYMFASGLPQPADFMLLAWSLLTVALLSLKDKVIVSKDSKNVIYFSLAFLAWVVFVSSLNALIFSDPDIAFYSLFYFFNILVFVSFIFWVSAYESAWNTVKISFYVMSGSVIFFWLMDFSSDMSRMSGSFNNPNQLAYFCLLLSAFAVSVLGKNELLRFSALFMLFSLFVIIISSASLSAYAGAMLVAAAFCVRLFRKELLVKFFLYFSVALVVFFFFFYGTEKFDIINDIMSSRIGMLDRKMDNVAGVRGYDRIMDYPQYIFLGAGERGLYRFDLYRVGEIHSTFGMLVFSYGVVGFSIFSLIIFFSLRKAPFYHILALAGPLLYSTTHVGVRVTLFWILVAAILLGKERAGYQGSLHDDS